MTVGIRVRWFIAGFLVGTIAVALVAGFLLRPRDLTRSWRWRPPAEGYLGWARWAVARTAGEFTLAAPAEESNASAMLAPTESCQPQVIIDDGDKNGIPDGIPDMVNVSCPNGDVTLDLDVNGSLSKYSVGFGAISDKGYFNLSDVDLDGEFDLRIAPGRPAQWWIASGWHEMVWRDGQRYVIVDYVEREVVVAGGKLKLKE